MAPVEWLRGPQRTGSFLWSWLDVVGMLGLSSIIIFYLRSETAYGVFAGYCIHWEQPRGRTGPNLKAASPRRLFICPHAGEWFHHRSHRIDFTSDGVTAGSSLEPGTLQIPFWASSDDVSTYPVQTHPDSTLLLERREKGSPQFLLPWRHLAQCSVGGNCSETICQ